MPSQCPAKPKPSADATCPTTAIGTGNDDACPTVHANGRLADDVPSGSRDDASYVANADDSQPSYSTTGCHRSVFPGILSVKQWDLGDVD